MTRLKTVVSERAILALELNRQWRRKLFKDLVTQADVASNTDNKDIKRLFATQATKDVALTLAGKNRVMQSLHKIRLDSLTVKDTPPEKPLTEKEVYLYSLYLHSLPHTRSAAHYLIKLASKKSVKGMDLYGYNITKLASQPTRNGKPRPNTARVSSPKVTVLPATYILLSHSLSNKM